MITPLLTGVSLGFSAGIGPGPLTTLVITTTLERGFAAGLRIAIAPLLTDLPIILACLWIVNALRPEIAALLAIAGGLYLIWLGIKTLRSAQHAVLAGALHSSVRPREDLWRGFLVNLLSPNPWIFWLGVGGPILTEAWGITPVGALGFLVGFYSLLVGCKIALAWLVAGGRRYLTNSWYRRLLAASGLLLIGFGLLLGWQAVIV
jgi:threonine/homoserine/homoserine lactone efflux protein